MKRFLAIAVLAVAVFLTAGCPKDPYRAAIQGSDDVSQGVKAAISLTTQYYNAKTVNDSQKATIGNYLGTVTDCNIKFRASVTAAHNVGQTAAVAFLPIADGFVQCAEAQRSVMADMKVYNVLKAVDVAINGVEAAIASAEGVK